MNNFDIIIPLKYSDYNTALQTIDNAKKYINPKRIVIIASSKLLSIKSFDRNNICFIDEDNIYNGLSLSNVKKEMGCNGLNQEHAGWYMQQFIKMAYSFLCNDEYYMVWDADTIPLRDINFFDENNVPFLTLKREYHKRYFCTLKLLLNIDKQIDESFISEHMLINSNICKEIISKIESNTFLHGDCFWKKIIHAVSFSSEDKSFSEFETYGSYVYANYPDTYTLRKLETLRCAKKYFPENAPSEMFQWASKDFDTISFEKAFSCKESYLYIIHFFIKIMKKYYTFKESILLTHRIFKFLSRLRIYKCKKIYNILLYGMEFDYIFSKHPIYNNKNEKK